MERAYCKKITSKAQHMDFYSATLPVLHPLMLNLQLVAFYWLKSDVSNPLTFLSNYSVASVVLTCINLIQKFYNKTEVIIIIVASNVLVVCPVKKKNVRCQHSILILR